MKRKVCAAVCKLCIFHFILATCITLVYVQVNTCTCTCTLYGVPYLQNTSNIKMIRSICLSLLASLVLRVSQAFVHCTDPVCINFIATSYLYEQSSLDNELILLTFAKYLLQKSDWSSIMMAALQLKSSECHMYTMYCLVQNRDL